MRICVYIYAHIHTSMYIHISSCMSMNIRVCVYVYAHKHVYIIGLRMPYPSGPDGPKYMCAYTNKCANVCVHI